MYCILQFCRFFKILRDYFLTFYFGCCALIPKPPRCLRPCETLLFNLYTERGENLKSTDLVMYRVPPFPRYMGQRHKCQRPARTKSNQNENCFKSDVTAFYTFRSHSAAGVGISLWQDVLSRKVVFVFCTDGISLARS